MEEFKGTKGEWKYEGGDNNSIDLVLPDHTTISIDRQSRYTSEYVLSREGMEANAKLIAAAPDLLEALKLLLDEHVKLVSSGDCGYWDVEEDEEVIKARKAINKALK